MTIRAGLLTIVAATLMDWAAPAWLPSNVVHAAEVSQGGPPPVEVGDSMICCSMAEGAINVGCGRQLFIGPWAEDGRDEYLVESMKNVTMTMNEAGVTGERLMEATRPWEQPEMCVNNFVIKDGAVFRVYYSALPKSTEQGPYSGILCYGESKDGIHWTKPNLGLCEWEGSRENNILFPNDDFKYVFSYACAPPVFIDPAAGSPDEKYKMFMKVTPWEKAEDAGMKSLPKAQYAFCSPDGLRWKLATEKRVNPRATDTQFSVFWDERIGQYVGYTRMKPVDEAQIKYYKQRYGFEGRTKVRGVGRMVSDDFRNWSGETAVIFPDEIDRANSPPGLKRVDFYGGNVSRYTEAPDVYLSLLTVFSHWGFDLAKRARSKSGHWSEGEFPATIDVQLATSRDGIHWNRTPRRRPFIRLGPEGSFWSKMIFPCASVIRVGDELWIYFTGAAHSHSEPARSWVFSRAVLRLDGFISADADYTGGELTTRPLVFPGSRLELNVATGAGGTVQVEIQDQAGKPSEGYTIDDADEINGNYIRVPASWNGHTDVSSLAGRPIRLRFVMRDCRLYAFQFKAGGKTSLEIWDGKEWVRTPARTLDDLAGFTPARETRSSRYGGRLDMKVQPTGFFRTEKVGGRWWMVDPDGHLFLSVGLCSVNQSHFSDARLKESFGTFAKWAEATVAMLKSHAFNSLGCWSDWQDINEVGPRMPYFTRLNFMLTYKKRRDPKYGKKGFQNQCMPVFDPGFETYCNDRARRLLATKDDPWLVGHFSDNELPFRPNSLTNFLALPATDPGYQAASKWWEDRRKTLGKAEDDIDTRDQQAFITFLADRYYSVANAAIKKYDPNHLYFGSRLHGRNINLAVFRAAAAVDVVSVNYYYSGPREKKQMEQWLEASGKPFLVSEWYAMSVKPAKVRQIRGAGYRVKTARERGLFYQNRVLGFLENPGCVGWHWFKYAGQEELSHRGVVNGDYQPCRPLMDIMKTVNQQVYPLADYFQKTKSEGEFQIQDPTTG